MQRFPQILSDVHGKGLLIGMEFHSDPIGWKCASSLFKRGCWWPVPTPRPAHSNRTGPHPDGTAQEMLNEVGGHV
jgi:acetylornithine/succinyldiaminopimelate/putrescine aminotransferase